MQTAQSAPGSQKVMESVVAELVQEVVRGTAKRPCRVNSIPFSVFASSWAGEKDPP